jgi:RNA polymerase sigma-70 factor, ECF subfamily
MTEPKWEPMTRRSRTPSPWCLEQTSEEVLVLAAIAGDVTSFDELVRRWRPAVTRTVGRVVTEREAREDIVQEVFLQAFRYLPHLAEPLAFPGWLRQIATRLARRRNREERARGDRLSPLDAVVLATCPAVGEAPEEQAMLAADRERLHLGLAQLAEPLRETVELRFLSGMQLAEIAAYQGISLEGVKWRLRKALERLRAAFGTVETAEGIL